MKEVKIIDLPERKIERQDYALIVNPDGTHNKGLYGDVVDETERLILEGEVGGILEQAQSKVDEMNGVAEEIFDTFSLADSIGEYDASTGIAKVTQTGATSTPGIIPDFSNGKYFDVVVAGIVSITGVEEAMEVGGKIIVRGDKWGYIPNSDLALSKSLKLENDTALMVLMTENTAENGLNGATVTKIPLAITIPNGQTGASSSITKTILIANQSTWVPGNIIRFFIVFSENVFNTSGSRIAVRLNVNRGAGFVPSQEGIVVRERIGDNLTVKAYFDYTIQATDVSLQPFVQVFSSAPVNLSGSNYVFTVKGVYSHVTNPRLETNPITEKLDFIEASVSNNANQILAGGLATQAKSIGFSAIPTSFVSTALQGATGSNTKRITIPTGQSGHTSYLRWLLPTTEFPSWQDMPGKVITFQYRVLMSTDLYPTKNLSVTMDVNRGAGYVAATLTSISVTKITATELSVKFLYTATLSDITLRPTLQITSGSNTAVTSDSFYEVQDTTYSHDIPGGYLSENTYPTTLEKAWYMQRVGALELRTRSSESTIIDLESTIIDLESTIIDLESKIAAISPEATETVLTVSPDGDRMFLSPALANASITDSSVYKKYRIVIYQGVYTNTEVTIKPYTTWEGVDKDLCWLKGEMPNSATDSQITNTSTIWLKKTSAISNLKITAKNMRYAVHSEDSGLAPDAVHDIYNCHIEHYGNQGAVDWRTANPGSGLVPANVWAQPRPWGFGSSSGLIENYSNSTFISPREAYYVHNNKDFTKPNINTASNCRFMSNYGFGKVIEVVNLGSRTPDVVDLRSCDFTAGFIQYSDTPWSYTDPSKQFANRAEFSSFVSGHTTPLGYRDITRGRALRIVSNNISGASSVRISGSAASVLFGQTTERDLGFGVKGYLYGYWDISGSLVGSPENITVNNTVGRRLGDCTTTSKTLSVTLNGGSTINIVFNQNYTSVSNSVIIANINTSLGTDAFADEYNPATWEYYPEMYGKQITATNNSSTKSIPAWSPCVLDTNRNSVRVMQPSDPADKFIGFNPFAIPPKGINRVLIEGYLQKIQAAGLAAATVVNNSDISMSATEGTVEVSSLKVIGKGVATDWFYFRGSI